MFDVQCSFSGWMIPRGRGIHKVQNDNKVIFTRGRRERTLVDTKRSAKNIKWTETSRAFFNKAHRTSAKEAEFIPITKIVRGFPFIPKALVKHDTKPSAASQAGVKQNERMNKNANMNIRK